MKISELKNRIDKIEFDGHDADMVQMYDLVDDFRKLDKEREIVPYLFNFFEQHYDKFLGGPGPFVHFIEENDDYREILLESIKNKPTDHTVYMINRILNGPLGKDEKEFWLSILSSVLTNKNADNDAMSSAKEFIDYQKQKEI